MRFLKTKIMRALAAQTKKSEIMHISSFQDQEVLQSTQSPDSVDATASSNYVSKVLSTSHLKERCRSIENSDQTSNGTKNIAINFGRAIASFAASNLAVPYLSKHFQEKKFTPIEFLDFVTQAKRSIKSIRTFKSLIMVQRTDSPQQAAMKGTFKAIAEIFIKFFSVNWIIHGKLTHKMIYLKFRKKMLRRIQSPESFTYIKKRNTYNQEN